MRTIIVAVAFFCMATFSVAAEQAETVYDGGVLTEDTIWRGAVFVNGSVVVAPQATLRIEPGTVVQFAITDLEPLPNLIIQGRIEAVGTSDRPVILTANRLKKPLVFWGGIVLLATDKRNLFEQCHIEHAVTGIDLRYSSISLKSVSILGSRTALLSRDSVIQTSSCTVSASDTGIELSDSEFEGRNLTVSSCQRGMLLGKSSLLLTSARIINNKQFGLDAVECRIKITGTEFSGNAEGATIKGGEGQISMSSFLNNSQTALHLSNARLKVQRCLFADNRNNALRVEDGRSLLLNNAFSSNGGFNIYNAGREVVAARQNWWGGVDKKQIFEKISDAASDKSVGVVQIFPWLNEKPQLMP